jgi:hypothetical protein
VFFTSSGFVLGKHHCKMKQKMSQGEIGISCSETGCQKGCCSTEFRYFKLDQDQQNTSLGNFLSTKLSQFAQAYSFTFLLPSPENNTKTPKFFLYKPPLITKDIPVLLESFLL